jgi:hypothetical protein
MIAAFGGTAYSVFRCPPFPRLANQLTSRGCGRARAACLALVYPALWRQEGSARDTNAIFDKVCCPTARERVVSSVYLFPQTPNIEHASCKLQSRESTGCTLQAVSCKLLDARPPVVSNQWTDTGGYSRLQKRSVCFGRFAASSTAGRVGGIGRG